MAIKHVSTFDRTDPLLPTSMGFSFLDSKIKRTALSILGAIAIGGVAYLITASLPITLAAGITFLLLCLLIHYLTRPAPESPLPLSGSALEVPIVEQVAPSSQFELEVSDTQSIPLPSPQPSLQREPLPLPNPQSEPQVEVRAHVFKSSNSEWQKKLIHLMGKVKSGCKSEDVDECRNILTKYGAHCNDSLDAINTNGTILHALAKIGVPEFVLIFKECGVDFTTRDRTFGNTGIHWAIANANNLTALEMIEHSPSSIIDSQSTFGGNTALHLSIAKGYTTKSAHGQPVGCANFELTSALITKGARSDIPNHPRRSIPLSGGNTALHIACARRDILTLQLLMQHKPNLEALNNSKQKPASLIDFTYAQACEFLRAVVGEVFILKEDTFEESAEAARKILSSATGQEQ